MRRDFLKDHFDNIMEIPFVPLVLTEHSESRGVRIAGALAFMVGFLPIGAVMLPIAAVFGLGSIIQEAWRGDE